VEAPHAAALCRQGTPSQFSNTAKDRAGRRAEGRMLGAGSRVRGVALGRGVTGGGSEGGVAGVGSGSGGLASRNEEGAVVVVVYLARYKTII